MYIIPAGQFFLIKWLSTGFKNNKNNIFSHNETLIPQPSWRKIIPKLELSAWIEICENVDGW